MDLLSAGTDTTSNTITFAIMFLAIHQDVQAKIHKEMDDAIGRDRLPTIRDRPDLVYTDATLMEVLRFRGPLPIMIPHRVTKNSNVYGYDLPLDCHLLINVHSVLMDKQYWKDPETFRPERFVTPEGKIRKEERLIPFGKGKRSCLGETLARIMSFVFFASLVQAYKFTLAPGVTIEDTRGVYGFTLAPPEFKVVATPRIKIQ
ncbi:UNVERIFIED_CONTAM: hypothetical protein GTU68_031379 [Idotea baltica]|nr:hypothetical protein [Idotea baltica]